jgi:hypothetical protein
MTIVRSQGTQSLASPASKATPPRAGLQPTLAGHDSPPSTYLAKELHPR